MGLVAVPRPPGPAGCNDSRLVDLRSAKLSDLDGLRSAGIGNSVPPIGVVGLPGNSRFSSSAPRSGEDGICERDGILGRGYGIELWP